MQHTAIQQWLKKKAVADAAHHFLFALFVFAVGAAVLGVTFVFVGAVVWFVLNVGAAALSQILLNRRLHVSAAAIAVISALFVAFLFAENRRTQREYFGRRGRAPFQRPGEFGGELMSLLVYSDVSSRLVADALLTGPDWRAAAGPGPRPSASVNSCRSSLVKVRPGGSSSMNKTPSMSRKRAADFAGSRTSGSWFNSPREQREGCASRTDSVREHASASRHASRHALRKLCHAPATSLGPVNSASATRRDETSE